MTLPIYILFKLVGIRLGVVILSLLFVCGIILLISTQIITNSYLRLLIGLLIILLIFSLSICLKRDLESLQTALKTYNARAPNKDTFDFPFIFLNKIYP